MRNLKQFSSEDALEKIEELLDIDLPDGSNDDEYEKICDVVGMSVYDTDEDIIDEESLIYRVKDALDDGWLEKAKRLLEDIDLSADFWRIDGNGYAVNIDRADCEYLRDEIVKDLADMLDEEDMEKFNDMMERIENSD
jgi:hypothetical protein